jgi:hypothetical protein
MQDIQQWVVCISGVTFDPNPSLLKRSYFWVRDRGRQHPAPGTAEQETNTGRVTRSYLWLGETVNKIIPGDPSPKPNDKRARLRHQVQMRVRQLMSKLPIKRGRPKLNELGAVSRFATQQISTS